MKLSELTYDYLCSIGLSTAHMHTTREDMLRCINSQWAFDQAKKELMDHYGDVNLIIQPDADWYKQIRIDDEKWQKDHDDFNRRKQEWCNKYGCD